MQITFSIHLDFDDDQAATLLGVNPNQEACLICVHVYDGAGSTPECAQDAAALGAGIVQASTVSDKEVVYTDIIDIHQAGGAKGDQPTTISVRPRVLTEDPLSWVDLGSPAHSNPSDYRDVLWQRRSRRNFMEQPVSMERVEAFLDLMVHTMGVASGMPAAYRSAVVTGLLIGDRMPLPGGFYILDAQKQRLGRLCAEPRLAPMAGACLDQMWLKHAGLHVLFMSDIEALDRRWGARGYRYAMIEAGRLGQQAYLSATALGWGACGIGAIYDREAAQLLDLASGASLLYLVGVGPVKKR